MGWLDALQTEVIPEKDLMGANIDPSFARGANTPEELSSALTDVRK
jgi:hypothetical protein